MVPESHPTRPELFTEKAEAEPGKAHSSRQMGPASAPGKSSGARCLSGSPLRVQTEAGGFSHRALVSGLLLTMLFRVLGGPKGSCSCEM